MTKEKELILKLAKNHSLSLEEYAVLIDGQSQELMDLAKEQAVFLRQEIYGRDVYIRGLIEISSHCKNNCLYCGIRRGNLSASRYRLEKDEILGCCREGYSLGFRTFVLQGGEDVYYTDDVLCQIIEAIKDQFPDCAVTLSLGERSRESYEKLFQAGGDRYLLRHETADREHYQKLHPEEMSFENRMECLRNLKDIGFQTGCGFMVGSPFQTSRTLAADLKFVEEFAPAMCGIGPFIPHHATPFSGKKAGTLSQTLYLLSLIRLISPSILLPATTALGTIHPKGRELGMMAGANVVMPNLSPLKDRKKYELYDNKIYTGDESAQCKDDMEKRMKAIGYTIVTARGDAKEYHTRHRKE